MSLRIDPSIFILAAALALAFFFLRYLLSRIPSPRLFFSNLEGLVLPASKPLKLYRWGFYCYNLSFILFLIAFFNPRIILPQSSTAPAKLPPPTEGIAIYLVLDQSGSMSDRLSPLSSSEGLPPTKIELLRSVTKSFIMGDPSKNLQGRTNDLVGLVGFARTAQVLVPLTLDRRLLLDQLSHFDIVKNIDEEGTAIGYAIFKTANLIAATRHFSQELAKKERAVYTINDAIIILVTDGLQDPNPLDKDNRWRSMSLDDAAAYAKEQGVRLYIVNVDPAMNTEEYAPYRRLMERITKLTGGEFFQATDEGSLGRIYADINSLEKMPIENYSKSYLESNQIMLAPYLIAIGLMLLLLAAFCNEVFWRTVP